MSGVRGSHRAGVIGSLRCIRYAWIDNPTAPVLHERNQPIRRQHDGCITQGRERTGLDNLPVRCVGQLEQRGLQKFPWVVEQYREEGHVELGHPGGALQKSFHFQ